MIYIYVCADCHVEIENGLHPELLPRDGNEHEKRMHGLKPGDNMSMDYWEGQQIVPEVWVEKDALIDVLETAADPFDVLSFSTRGCKIPADPL